jgi:PAS domain-containing protein
MGEKDLSRIHGDQPAAVTADVLSDRKELAATAFQRTRMPMVVTDATQRDYPIVLANEAFLELTGYSAGRFLAEIAGFSRGRQHQKSPFPKFEPR